jgi:group II intron reverse transcriptase/maturase
MGPLMGNTKDTTESESVYTKQQRIAELAVVHQQVSFTSLAYHVDLEWLREAYRRTRKDAVVGVDGMTAAEYEANLDERLRNLLERFKSGTYKAPPVRRVYIPKDEKGREKRPIGIPTLEDKILQRAVLMLLEPLYEQDFRQGSYGFRPGRSQHQALNALDEAMRGMRGECWVLEIDIRKFFDTMEHQHLTAMLKHRVCDGVIVRMIGKWLKAGVMEGATLHYPDEGSPQGGVISPLLRNIYLHEVLDAWFEREITPRLKGSASFIRFADDAVLVFGNKHDADRVYAVLPKRFAKYGLTLHPEKTRLVPYGKPGKSVQEPGTFDFLGFAHYWGKSRKGYWVMKRKTAKQRLKRAIVRVNKWCRVNMHEPIEEQWKTLCAKVRGHYQYYGVPFNSRGLSKFLWNVKCSWRKWLGWRSGGKEMSWERFAKLLRRYPLPNPRICHSYA